MIVDRIIEYISTFLALIIVLPVHEFAHAFVADKCGDKTPRALGRLTINPLAHFDPFGLVCFVLAGFGWAKPVPINPNNFKNYKKSSFLVAIAGVIANYILAFFAYPLYKLSLYIPHFGYFTTVLSNVLYLIYALGISFFIFNLLPIYPLDGFRIIDTFSKKRGKLYWILRTKGVLILFLFFVLNFLADTIGVWQLDVLGNLISVLSKYVAYPIYSLWGLIF